MINVLKETEKEFAKFTEFKYCILTNSGTSSLFTIYKAIGLDWFNEVITTPFTYYSTVNMLQTNEFNTNVKFADINKSDYLINPKEVKKLITKNTKAIVAVNLFGKEVNYSKLKFKNIPLVIDSCQCCKPGIKGDIVAFSFQRSKNFNTGEGGAICTNDARLAKLCRLIVNQGEDTKYHTICIGYNFRMSEYLALMLYNQIKYHSVGGLAELGRYSIKNSHYPRVVYDQPYYHKNGLYEQWIGKCPIAEETAKLVRTKYWCKK